MDLCARWISGDLVRLCPLRNCWLAIRVVRETTSSLAYRGSSTICCSVFLQHMWLTPLWVIWGHVCLPLSQVTHLLSQLHGKYLLSTVWFPGCPHSSSFSVPPTLATSLETAHSSLGCSTGTPLLWRLLSALSHGYRQLHLNSLLP